MRKFFARALAAIDLLRDEPRDRRQEDWLRQVQGPGGQDGEGDGGGEGERGGGEEGQRVQPRARHGRYSALHSGYGAARLLYTGTK